MAFFRTQGEVSLTQTCAPATIAQETGRSTCEVAVQNNSLQDTSAVARSRLTSNLRLTDVTGAFQASPREVVATANLAGRELGEPTIAPNSTSPGYVPLDAFGFGPDPIGDEEAINYTVPAFDFAGERFTTIGVTSNGYSGRRGHLGRRHRVLPAQDLPNPAPPNGVLAPFWTDLDGTGAPGIFAAELTDGVDSWIVVEWRVHLFGTTSLRVFQHWLGINGAEDVSFVYDPANLPAAPPAALGLTVGAENSAGTAGDQLEPAEEPPTQDLRVTSTPGSPGGSMAYSFELKGVAPGTGEVRTTMRTPLVRGTTTDFDQVTVEGT